MKKNILVMATLVLAISLIGCSNEKSNNSGTTTTTEAETQAEKTLSDLENYFLEKGIVTGERTLPYAEMIGAEKGFKYLDSSIDVYEYDTSSDAYKGLVQTNTVEVEGFGDMVISAVNGKFVLMCEDSPNKDSIIAVFNDFK